MFFIQSKLFRILLIASQLLRFSQGVIHLAYAQPPFNAFRQAEKDSAFYLESYEALTDHFNSYLQGLPPSDIMEILLARNLAYVYSKHLTSPTSPLDEATLIEISKALTLKEIFINSPSADFLGAIKIVISNNDGANTVSMLALAHSKITFANMVPQHIHKRFPQYFPTPNCLAHPSSQADLRAKFGEQNYPLVKLKNAIENKLKDFFQASSFEDVEKASEGNDILSLFNNEEKNLNTLKSIEYIQNRRNSLDLTTVLPTQIQWE